MPVIGSLIQAYVILLHGISKGVFSLYDIGNNSIYLCSTVFCIMDYKSAEIWESLSTEIFENFIVVTALPAIALIFAHHLQ